MQSAFDSLVAPIHVFAGHAKNQIHDLLIFRWPSQFASRLRTYFGLKKLSVPTQDRVALRNCRDLSKLFSAESFAFHGQESSLIIGKQNSFASNLLAKYLIL